MDKSALASRISGVVANVEKVIFGKHHEVELALVALVCRGHILVEDVPGTGKTVLAKAIARSLGCSFRRIQFTPDLLPSDVTGVSIFNQRTSTFERRPPAVYLGASPGGPPALARASAAFALLQGRDFVLPDDVKQLAAPTLSHRLILQPQARLKDLAATTVIAEVLASVPVELSPTAARA